MTTIYQASVNTDQCRVRICCNGVPLGETGLGQGFWSSPLNLWLREHGNVLALEVLECGDGAAVSGSLDVVGQGTVIDSSGARDFELEDPAVGGSFEHAFDASSGPLDGLLAEAEPLDQGEAVAAAEEVLAALGAGDVERAVGLLDVRTGAFAEAYGAPRADLEAGTRELLVAMAPDVEAMAGGATLQAAGHVEDRIWRVGWSDGGALLRSADRSSACELFFAKVAGVVRAVR